MPEEVVERCVRDVLARASHLGLEISPDQLERISRQHLIGRLKSEPPTKQN